MLDDSTLQYKNVQENHPAIKKSELTQPTTSALASPSKEEGAPPLKLTLNKIDYEHQLWIETYLEGYKAVLALPGHLVAGRVAEYLQNCAMVADAAVRLYRLRAPELPATKNTLVRKPKKK